MHSEVWSSLVGPTPPDPDDGIELTTELLGITPLHSEVNQTPAAKSTCSGLLQYLFVPWPRYGTRRLLRSVYEYALTQCTGGFDRVHHPEMSAAGLGPAALGRARLAPSVDYGHVEVRPMATRFVDGA